MMGESVVADSSFYQGTTMNEDNVNLEIRKFLKKVGITSQREIERALQQAEAAGKLVAHCGDELTPATYVLSAAEILAVPLTGSNHLPVRSFGPGLSFYSLAEVLQIFTVPEQVRMLHFVLLCLACGSTTQDGECRGKEEHSRLHFIGDFGADAVPLPAHQCNT